MPKQTKQILSIDVGIKNLSFCLFEINTTNINTTNTTNNIKVLKWDNIDLTKQDDIGSKCTYIDNGIKKAKKSKKGQTEKEKELEATTICDKPAKFLKDGKCYCLKHSKLTNFLIPPPDLKQSFLNKQTLQKLIAIQLCNSAVETRLG
jgi:hypothetical protein